MDSKFSNIKKSISEIEIFYKVKLQINNLIPFCEAIETLSRDRLPAGLYL